MRSSLNKDDECDSYIDIDHNEEVFAIPFYADGGSRSLRMFTIAVESIQRTANYSRLELTGLIPPGEHFIHAVQRNQKQVHTGLIARNAGTCF